MTKSRMFFAALALVLAAAPASAQFTAQPPQGLTVAGRGVVSVPADSLRFQLVLRGVPGTSLDETGKAVAQTLRQNGVPDAAWTLPLDGVIGAGSQPAVVGTIAKPTREKLEGLLRSATSALPPAVTAAISPQGTSLSWSLRVDDCGPALGRAQRSALDDARREAQTLARDANVALGAIVAISRNEQIAGCATSPDAESEFGVQRRGDAYGKLDVTVVVGLTVTYAIR